jgi:diguanylate cyclase (GGDEF)-like protein
VAPSPARPTTSIPASESINAGETLFDAVRAGLTDLDRAMTVPPPELAAQVADLSGVRTDFFFAAVAFLALALLLSTVFVTRWVSRPLAQLVKTARRVEDGEDVAFPAMRRDEIGDLAAALERMRRGMRSGQQTARAAAEEASVLNRFTELTAFSETDSDLADAVLTAIDELVHLDDASVHVSNRSRDRATVEGRRGESPAEALTLGALNACPGVRRGSLYVTPNVGGALAVRCPVYRVLDGTVACIPLTALGETIGVTHLHWHQSDAVPVGQRAVLSRVAEHGALSIGNRRLVNTLRGMANTDARTGLVNSRSFDESVEAILGARVPDGHEAILMLDIDQFKAFNDRYGHPAGDEALRAFAGIVRACLRKEDLPARYGGEEFAVHLRGLDCEAALEIAERIRSRLEASILPLGPGVTGRLTASIGVAVAPTDGADRISLLRVADEALYLAKAGGRNSVATTDGVIVLDETEPFAAAAS